MMSLGLVAYDTSDESDSEDETENVKESKPATNPKVEQEDRSKVSVPTSGSATASSTHSPAVEAPKNHTESDIKSFSSSAGPSFDTPILSWDIEDDEYDILPREPQISSSGLTLSLPPPKTASDHDTILADSLVGDQNSDPVKNPLAALPPPKPVVSGLMDVTEDDLEDEVKPKSYQMADVEKPPSKKVQITIPALPRDDDDEPANKKAKITPTGGSGLFSLLPAPKNAVTKVTNRPLIPDSISRKPASKPASKPSNKQISTTKPNPTPNKKTALIDTVDSDDDEDDTSERVNFFSLGETSSKPSNISKTYVSPQTDTSPQTDITPPGIAVSVPEVSEPVKDVVPGSSEDASGRGQSLIDMDAPLHFGRSNYQSVLSYKPQLSVPEKAQEEDTSESAEEDKLCAYPQYDESMAGNITYAAPDDVETYAQDEQFWRLQGKKARGKEEINIIDVNQDDQITSINLMKNLSEETDTEYLSRKKKDMPTSQQKRKHQITQLAYLAKERELNLKNQWAENRMTKKQTQSKYGF